jgi:hypothetical protein
MAFAQVEGASVTRSDSNSIIEGDQMKTTKTNTTPAFRTSGLKVRVSKANLKVRSQVKAGGLGGCNHSRVLLGA